MRIFIITILLQVLCSITVMSFADDKSDCLDSCSNDKRSNEMFCPPSGGFSDDDHKQCVGRIAETYKECVKVCSPPAEVPQQLPAKIEPTPESIDSVTTDNK